MERSKTCASSQAKPARTLLLRGVALMGLLGVGIALQQHPAKADADDRRRQFLPITTLDFNTVPSNGDVNPYGVAYVPPGFMSSKVHPGDVLVANFNNAANLQGTGTTIVALTPDGTQSLFFQGQPPLGLTGALGVVRKGFVLVGSLPSTDGTPATAQPGSVLVLDANGNLVETLPASNFIDGPWGLALDDDGDRVHVFVANVLAGTVSRIDAKVGHGMFTVTDQAIIGSGFEHRSDPAAFELGPAGLAYDDKNDVLFVTDSADNTVFAIGDAAHRTTSAGTGVTIFADTAHLRGPVSILIAPNGHLIASNSDGTNADPAHPSELVEFTVGGKFINEFSIDPNPAGAFGIALGPSPLGDDFLRLAVADDNVPDLEVFTQPAPCGR